MKSTRLFCCVMLWMSASGIPILTSRKLLPVTVNEGLEEKIITKGTQELNKVTTADRRTTTNPSISMEHLPKVTKKITDGTSIIRTIKSTSNIPMTESNTVAKRVPASGDIRGEATRRRRLDSRQTSTDIARMIKDIPHMSSTEIHTLYNKLRESGKLDLKSLSSLKEIVFKLDSMCCPI